MSTESLVTKAHEIVSEIFKNKKDLSGEPYIDHLQAVKETVYAYCGDEEQQAAALLHDILEDFPTYDSSSILEVFGQRVFDAVWALTRVDGEPYDVYIDRLSKNKDAVIVKIADLSHNMDLTRLNKITDKDIERIKKYHKAYKTLTQ